MTLWRPSRFQAELSRRRSLPPSLTWAQALQLTHAYLASEVASSASTTTCKPWNATLCSSLILLGTNRRLLPLSAAVRSASRDGSKAKCQECAKSAMMTTAPCATTDACSAAACARLDTGGAQTPRVFPAHRAVQSARQSTTNRSAPAARRAILRLAGSACAVSAYRDLDVAAAATVFNVFGRPLAFCCMSFDLIVSNGCGDERGTALGWLRRHALQRGGDMAAVAKLLSGALRLPNFRGA